MGDLLLSKARIKILILGVFIIFFLLALQLVRVQVIQASDYRSKAANEMELTRTTPAPPSWSIRHKLLTQHE
jgi:cell division protein FtsI (penicillin-binding protein 3)